MRPSWFLSRNIVIFVLTISSRVTASGNNVVCYYINSNGYSLFPPENMNADLCTHINYAFGAIDAEGFVVPQNEKLDVKLDLYERVANLTLKNPSLKILLSIGSVSASIFSSVAADKLKIEHFVNSAIKFLETYKFHGIDIDWEKPTADDSANFVSLLSSLRDGFDKSGSKWIISAAVYSNPSSGYNVPEMAKYLDMFNLMSYNYYGSWSAYTGQNSPLFESSIESNYEKANLNVAVSIKNWINSGVPQSKLNAGLAFFGRAFTLVSEEDLGLHAPIIGPGSTPTPTFRLICAEYTNWTTVWDDEQKNPYKYLKDQWVGYDDERSIKEKVNYIMSQDLAGVMVWHIGGDDVNGVCGEKQGLLKIVKDKINSH